MDEILEKFNELSLKDNKQHIIDLFNKNVKNKKFDDKKTHHGSEGHWLENLMKIEKNCNNLPDLYGYEMKKSCKKISFGDWSASEYIFKQGSVLKQINGELRLTRNEFLRIFGNFNIKKDRYNWSGKCIPKYNVYNNFGQILTTDKNDNILIIYDYKKDKRCLNLDWIKRTFILAYWDKNKLKLLIERKFNQKGFFILEKQNGIYKTIKFGNKITFSFWIENLKNGVIFFDSGMYSGNNRNYSQWRANKIFWDNLIIEEV